MIESIPWSQLTNLGAGGMFCVVILWLVLKFLDSRRSEIDKIVVILDNQTDILRTLSERHEEMHEKITVMHTRLDDVMSH